MTLRDVHAPTGVVMITRRISAESDTSEWLVDGKKRTEKDVISIVRGFNIRMENLCTFLPQERISAFASLRPEQLLRSTEEVFPAEGLYEQHERLIRLHKERTRNETEKSDKERELVRLRDELERSKEAVR